MKPDHISQRVQRQCGVPRHLVDPLPIEREDHSVASQASLPQSSLLPARDRCVRVRVSNWPERRGQMTQLRFAVLPSDAVRGSLSGADPGRTIPKFFRVLAASWIFPYRGQHRMPDTAAASRPTSRETTPDEGRFPPLPSFRARPQRYSSLD